MKQVKNIEEYIADFPEDVQERLQKVRETIRKAAPDTQEAIKYGIPTFVKNGNVIHFGGYQNHIGLYPGSKAIEEFADELSRYEVSKGTVRFPLNKPLPLGLITKITRFCVKRDLKKAVSRKGATTKKHKNAAKKHKN